jgi:sterol desaturase/sphingolipid hydroxylase (fatty acid hydroxylase superfamily)
VANNNKNRGESAAAAVPVSRLQRSLMYMAGSILGLGIIAIVALLIGEATLKAAIFESSPFWSVAAFLPEVAIPLGFLLFIALIVVTYVRRARAARDASK